MTQDEYRLPPTEYQIAKLKELLSAPPFTAEEAHATDAWLQKPSTRRGDVSRAIAKALARLNDARDTRR